MKLLATLKYALAPDIEKHPEYLFLTLLLWAAPVFIVGMIAATIAFLTSK
jgi:cytochrome c-type biogenesis protein CcmH/NrfF